MYWWSEITYRDVCPSLAIITRHQLCMDFENFSCVTRSKSWQSGHKIGFLQIYTKSPIVVGMIVNRSISSVYLFSSVDKRQLLARDLTILLNQIINSNMINLTSWQHTIRCRYSFGSVLLISSLLHESISLLLSAIHYSMMFFYITVFRIRYHRVHFVRFLSINVMIICLHSVPTSPTSIISSCSMTSMNAISIFRTRGSTHSNYALKDYVLHISRHLVNRNPDVFSTRYKLF